MHTSEQPTGDAAPVSKMALSVGEAARATGLGRTTLYELMDAGRLPYSKIGARRLLLTADVHALLMAHRSTAGQA